MNWPVAFALLTSVLLTTCSQLLMKLGMISPRVQAALGKGDPVATVTQIAMSPPVVTGLASFAVSVGLWLSVLARINVSQAYPCVALGFVFTMLGGHFLFGEMINMTRIAGLLLILSGVALVAVS